MENKNYEWVLNCINSCTNAEQLKTCEILIGLFKFRLVKDGITEAEIYKQEGELLSAYIQKESLFVIADNYEINFQ
jgi:hypothetical protein